MSNSNGNKTVTVKETHTFESTVLPGVTFTLRRRNVRRKIELETKLLEFQAKVFDIHVNAENAERESTRSSKGRSPRPTAPVEIGSSKPTPEGEEKSPAVDAEDNASPLFKMRYDSWASVKKLKEIDGRVELETLAKMRPIYLEVYLARVNNFVYEDEVGIEHHIETAEDVIEYAPEDFVVDIFNTMQSTREIGFALDKQEIKNLQLPSTLPGQVVGQNGSTSAGGVSRAVSTESVTVTDSSPS